MRIALSSKLEMGQLRVVQDLAEGGWIKTTEANRALCDGYHYIPPLKQPVELETPVPEKATADEAVPDQAALEEAIAAQSKVVTGAEAEVEVLGEQGAVGEEGEEEEAESERVVIPRRRRGGQRVFVSRFGKPDGLSILFVHPPKKTAESLWPFARVVRNIPGIEILTTDQLQVYHVLKYKWLVIEGSAVDAIIKQKGQSPVGDVNLGGSRSVKPTANPTAVEVKEPGMEEKKIRILPSWDLRGWRHDTGKTSLRKVFGMKMATKMEHEAKKAKNVAKRMGKLKLA